MAAHLTLSQYVARHYLPARLSGGLLGVTKTDGNASGLNNNTPSDQRTAAA